MVGNTNKNTHSTALERAFERLDRTAAAVAAEQYNRKRGSSPSFDDHVEQRRGTPPHPGSGMFIPPPRSHPSQAVALRRDPGYGRDESPVPEHLFTTPLSASGREWEYESPDSGDEKNPTVLHDLIAKRVDPLLQMNDGWIDFFDARARPQTVANVLAQYRFVHQLFLKYAGQRVPFKRARHYIEKVGILELGVFLNANFSEKSHIVAALLIDEDRFAQDCTETLRLLGLYGPEGSRLQDPRVSDMIADDTLPVYNAKPIKRLVRLLREIDEAWLKEHPSRADANAVDPGPSTGSLRDTS